ncbi:MAG: bifunctional ornithine acetyltransferase/N-acetylglutamate synthase [Nitrospirae bacterium RIFOXYB2_FULL_43_5]|nr:MAG: bifunctional ornithine acetyltransferase/N-acetylglutamate synthase [Nitrospirae bacterium GWF2_44_13]OGW66489.1 MAG: bifunctional ornithine acetyltransferase/N-acetylglutamate synthase [Nitrospirae bacterium RIFOXYA2_FULL_44_9]OGW70400.1 MAG: bifunctional ornithine acetyltransferase/N-acetylglutamate synthase [Nitrospirae bacterium RIFOXYC2_FULL_44_7]OGW76450.1 MAG: bifunctional ornithine acetyltransferase/N-acetylglutamate synthase [Nitrospirae bacterium RIFOXYB2_FULL_43_5]HBG92272.1 
MLKNKDKTYIPEGFLFSAGEAAIKKPGRKDIALIYSKTEANIAGAFTTNKVKAAPVRLDMEKIKAGRGQAITVNSGNANACTGRKGMQDAAETALLTAKNLKIKPSLVYVCSTGVIGTPMPMEKIRAAIPVLTANLGRASLRHIVSAIMTTDTFPKAIAKKIKIKNRTGTMTGICKGAGMIAPNMATMLCFIMTDIAIEKRALSKALKDSVRKSFNRITIDGDMSTNDTALIMANGMLGNSEIKENSASYKIFKNALDEVTCELSRLIVKDGEGATKLIVIEVEGAADEKEAEKAAFAVANSNLVKTAVYGNDANWGRIMAALGYSGIKFIEEKVSIHLGNIKVVNKGTGTGKDAEANNYLKNNSEASILINLNKGSASAKVLTCDLTEEYIRVNADYRT